MKQILFILITLVLTIPVKAQWSSDPTENNQLALENNVYDWDSRVLSDGTIAVYYNKPDGYFPTGIGDTAFFLKHVLMLYNSDGTPVWDSAKVFSSPNRTFTMVNEYLFIDGDDNIMVAVPDCRYDTFGEMHPSGSYKWYKMNLTLYKVSKTGEHLWGENGVSIDSTPHDLIAQTNAIALENGSIIVAYSQEEAGNLKTKIARLNAETGAVIWLKDLLPNGSNAKLIDGGNNEFIIVYNSIAAQKLDAGGNEVWPHTVIYNKGGFPVAPLHTNIKVLPVERGAFISWYADPDNDNFEDAYCSYINRNGEIVFSAGTDGVKLGMKNNIRQFSPTGIYDPVNKFVYYMWCEMSSGQTWSNMVGQKISLTGELIWDANGVEVAPMLERRVSYPSMGIDDDGNPAFFYLETTNGQNDFAGYAQKRTPAGDSLWNVTFTSITDDDEHIYSKSNLMVLPFSQDQWVALWSDNRPLSTNLIDQNSVWGQNINKNGSIGDGQPPITANEASAKANTGNTHFFVASNPVAGEASFTVKGLEGQKIEISILNAVGKTAATVFKGTVAGMEESVVWNTSSLSKGIYIARLRTSAGVETIKLVIK
ncbi:MAG: T9SS type A sorting domain-containing protein [Bacteroidales bacterium]|jgi:hypothetical protein|nr:T9SS type A sorting domain-containing protein [Bacteroidales bacterium]